LATDANANQPPVIRVVERLSLASATRRRINQRKGVTVAHGDKISEAADRWTKTFAAEMNRLSEQLDILTAWSANATRHSAFNRRASVSG
jgi:hypothetical protein